MCRSTILTMQISWGPQNPSEYNIYKFKWIWINNKKVSFCTCLSANLKRKCTRVHAFSDKNDYRLEHLLMLDYHPGKFHIDLLSCFWEHSPTHVKYQSPIIYHSKVIAKVQGFFLNKWAKHQGQKFVFVGTHRKVLSQETSMWNVKAWYLPIKRYC
jgi:hypothetical protein